MDITVITFCLTLIGMLSILPATDAAAQPAPPTGDTLRLGWAQADITPLRPAALGGMASLRVSKEVKDPLTATALAIEAPYQQDNTEPMILISCDLRSINTNTVKSVRSILAEKLPGFDPMRVILFATHTHNAPPLNKFGTDTDAMDDPEYVEFAAPIIAKVAVDAWNNRSPGGISFGLAHAVVGHNRIMAYRSGESVMGHPKADENFSHVEGYEDHAANLLFTWDAEGKLTGVVVNLAVTAQVSQSEHVVSADFWHETRQELRARLGDHLFVLPQVSAAGDQMSRVQIDRRAEARMEQLSGRNRRQQIAVRIADAVTSIVPLMEKAVEWSPVLHHRVEHVPLRRRIMTEKELADASAAKAKAQAEYDKAMNELKERPELANDAAWIRNSTRVRREINRGNNVDKRHQLQVNEPQLPVELHAVRLGNVAMAFNPFELYLDFGIRMKVRSPAVQTFVVELATCENGSGYVPTHRAVAGGAYGAVPASNIIGPEGGDDLVNWTISALKELWKQ